MPISPEQVLPVESNLNPLLQPQVKLPIVLVQVCAQLSVLTEHSLISVEKVIVQNINYYSQERDLYISPEQVRPLESSVNPLLQPQVKLPTVLLQVCAQLSVLAEHSLISAGK